MDNEIGEGLICGRNAVMEALKSGRAIEDVYKRQGQAGALSSNCAPQDLQIIFISPSILDKNFFITQIIT